MPAALLALRGPIVGILLALPVASLAIFQLATANDAAPIPAATAPVAEVDPVTTASIAPDMAPAIVDGEPSAAFREALAVLSKGEEAEAYALARSLESDLERRTIQWAAIHNGAGEIDHASVQRFMADAPLFVNPATFRTRLEQALIRTDASGAEVIAALGDETPNTVEAQVELAIAYLDFGQKERAQELARAVWTGNFLERHLERKVLERLGELLTRDDHWARAVHLMMHDRASATERLFQFMTPAQKSLAAARNAVSRKAGNAKALLDAVDPAMQSHPVFIFSRVQRARQAGLFESAVTWLEKAPAEVPEAAEWWYERRTLVRQLLAEGDARLAYRAADGYHGGSDGRMVEAHFHAGWIALSFLGDAEAARSHFAAMTGFATLPESVGQANFWLGRALLRLGRTDDARAAFQTAADHPTVYYGQLARAELGLNSAELRTMPAWQQSEAAFEALEPVRAVRLLVASGKRSLAIPLLKGFVHNLADGEHLALAARLAQTLDAHNLAIYIADIAEKRGTPLDLFSFPRDGLPTSRLAEVDMAAVYAITKQESLFQVDAVSSAGARGLMQLMPATARETATKVGVEYSKTRLTTDGAYNALLGSTYLADQLDRYDGSLVLAAAAYNAGAGNANKWIRAYGDPRAANVDPVVWVELIPFQETRKYVQRVLGNYLVYRARLGDEDTDIRQALRRIPG